MSSVALRTVRLTNLLSFGPDTEETRLGPLNVLIGPNGSGKSNLIEALSLLKAATRDLLEPIREGGGTREWLWKGAEKPPVAGIDVTIDYPGGKMPLRYRLSFTVDGQRFHLIAEEIEDETASAGEDEPDFYLHRRHDESVMSVLAPEKEMLGKHDSMLDSDQSVLSQRKDPDRFPQLAVVADIFSRLGFYREWNFGRDALPRLPQTVDFPEDFLREAGHNLALVLNDLDHRGEPGRLVNEKLKILDERFDRYTTKVQGGTIQLFLHEKGLNAPISAARLSDGTLRYLCLLAVLCHPSPPPVVCIEEPEIGLHPDALQTVAELLVDASKRTQLIVTTHSDVLVSALSDTPESVLVCEKTEGGTELRRLDKDNLAEWLDKYSLGEIWRMGEIGGNRW